MDIETLPDIDKLSSDIIDIIQYVDSNISTDLENIRNELLGKYENVPFSIIKLLTMSRDKKIQAENIDRLLNLLNDLQKVKENEMTLDDCKNKFREIIAERYIYPNFGGKEKFEKHIMDRQNQKK